MSFRVDTNKLQWTSSVSLSASYKVFNHWSETCHLLSYVHVLASMGELHCAPVHCLMHMVAVLFINIHCCMVSLMGYLCTKFNDICIFILVISNMETKVRYGPGDAVTHILLGAPIIYQMGNHIILCYVCISHGSSQYMDHFYWYIYYAMSQQCVISPTCL